MNWLLDTTMGPPGPAGHWPTWLSIVFHLSNFVLGFTYLLIPVLKHAYWPYRGSGISNRQYWQIMAYLPMMAVSRFIRVAEIWGPPYHLTTVVDALAAATAVYSFYHIQFWFRHVITLPSVQERDDLLTEITRINHEKLAGSAYLTRRNQAIFRRIDQLQASHTNDYPSTVVLAEIRALLIDTTDLRDKEVPSARTTQDFGQR